MEIELAGSVLGILAGRSADRLMSRLVHPRDIVSLGTPRASRGTGTTITRSAIKTGGCVLGRSLSQYHRLYPRRVNSRVSVRAAIPAAIDGRTANLHTADGIEAGLGLAPRNFEGWSIGGAVF